MSDNRLRRLKGLLIITAWELKHQRAETAMSTLTLAMDTVASLSPEEIDLGFMLDSDMQDLVPHDPATSEISEVAAQESFAETLARMRAIAEQTV